MKLTISICVLAFVCTLISAEDTEWDEYKFKLSKSFRNNGDEDSHRQNYLKRTQGFADHNKKYAEGTVSFKLGPNEYSDLSPADFELYLCGTKVETPEQLAAAPHLIRRGTPLLTESTEPLPDFIDWNKKGVVTAVKNQGHCGSCYAFATVGILEPLFCEKFKSGPTSLSPQNLVDCVPNNNGCKGGQVTYSLEYVIEKKGIHAEVTYPYAMAEQECKFNETLAFLEISGYRQIQYHNAEHMKRLVAENGPLAVLISASCNSFASYSDGVLDDDSCRKIQNHAVLITGYGTENGKDYWMVKNSWGPTWGKEGYIKVVRGKNQCGIEEYGYQAILKEE